MSKGKERQIPFTDETYQKVQEQADKSRRAFKHEAAILIEEALAHRASDAASTDG